MPPACRRIRSREKGDRALVRIRCEEEGQASVELVALLPLVAVLTALLWQAVLAGQAVWLAGSAARAAARATAVGGDARAAARRVLPSRLDGGLTISPDGRDGVRVALPVTAIIAGARLGTISARARLQPQSP